MRVFFLDFETYPIKPGLQAPRVVCGQIADGTRRCILAREAALDALESALLDPGVLIVAHSTSYEFLVSVATRPRLLPLWLDAYEANRVTCTEVRERLIRIAEGRETPATLYGLIHCLDRWKIVHDFQDGDKDGDGVRVLYHTLDHLDPADYPAEARRYALADLEGRELYEAQESKAHFFEDQYRRARGDAWLKATSAHGMRLDPRAVETFARVTEEEHALIRRALTHGDPEALRDFGRSQGLDEEQIAAMSTRAPEVGIVRAVGSKDTKRAAARMEAVCAARGIEVSRTEKGAVSLDADACAASGDLQLRAYARFTSIGTLRGRVDRLKQAASLGMPIQPRFKVLLKTGRTSASGSVKKGHTGPLLAFGDATQTFPRQYGLRDCFVARPGKAILSCDWRAAELHTLAQKCADLGLDSNLGRVLRSGRDVHLWFACTMNNWDYDWAVKALKGSEGPDVAKKVKKARQGAKACNFGFPGGLGIAKFIAWAAGTYDVILSVDEAKRLKALWLRAFPEMRAYFDWVDRHVASGEPLRHERSGRYRGDLTYTSCANSPFQGGCADMLIDAGWRIFAWIHRNAIPARIWNEAHDEILVEIDEASAHEVAIEIVRIMDQVGADWCPIAPCSAEPALQRHWRKAAEPVYRDGRLIPYEDRDLDAKTLQAIAFSLDSGEDPVQVSWRFAIEEERALGIQQNGT